MSQLFSLECNCLNAGTLVFFFTEISQVPETTSTKTMLNNVWCLNELKVPFDVIRAFRKDVQSVGDYF